MKRDVANAIEELKRAFPSSVVSNREDGQGGVYGVVESVCLGERFVPSVSWMGGHITALYPYADIYPVFMSADIRRVDGKDFEAPITVGHTFFDRPAIQISRRNNKIENSPQTAVAKLLKVINYLENLP